jgi:hypothetical protein
MAAYTDTIGFRKGSAAFTAPSGFSPIVKHEVVLDFAAITAARLAAGATALAQNDTLQVIQVPANASVIRAGIEIVSPETTNTTATLDLGLTGGDVDGWCDGQAVNAAAGTISINGVENIPASGTTAANFTTADTLDLLFLTAAPPVNAVIRVFAIMLDRN